MLLFFMVGEILEKFPDILDKILENGHEVGFHTMYHSRLDSDNFQEKFAKELEDFAILTNNKSKGFRAPTFSLNEKSSWVIDILEKYGYLYDSSIVPTKNYYVWKILMHQRILIKLLVIHYMKIMLTEKIIEFSINDYKIFRENNSFRRRILSTNLTIQCNKKKQ